MLDQRHRFPPRRTNLPGSGRLTAPQGSGGPDPSGTTLGSVFPLLSSAVNLTLVLALVLALAVPFAAEASPPALSLAVEAVSFPDARLDDLYGVRPALNVGLDLVTKRRMLVGLHASYSFGDTEPSAPDIITSARLRMRFIPIRLYARAIHRLNPSLQLFGGPQIGYAWFEETWKAYVGSADELGYHKASGSWLSVGAQLGARMRITAKGGPFLAVEYMVSSSDREAIPGHDSQNSSMDAGWYSVRLGWTFGGTDR